MLSPGAISYASEGPGGITHGSQITRTTFGPSGTLTPMGDATGVIETTGPNQIYTNFSCTAIRVRHPGCEFRNGYVLGDLVTGQYTVRHNETPYHAKFQDLTVVTRDPNTKGFVSDNFGATSEWRRCTFKGGEDQIFLHPTATNPTTGYGHWFEDIWAGDTTLPSGGHADCLQIDGGSGGVYVNRVNFRCFEVAPGSDPNVTQAIESVNTAGNAAFIITQKSTNPSLVTNVRVLNSAFNGGNWILYTDPDDGIDPTDVRVENCVFGRLARFGSFNIGTTHVSKNNRYDDGALIPDMNA